jgi:hypothetical protein
MVKFWLKADYKKKIINLFNLFKRFAATALQQNNKKEKGGK